MNALKEGLAHCLHNLWAEEMSFIIGKYWKDTDIPKSTIQELVDKINSPYEYLSEESKNHYKAQAQRIIKIFIGFLEIQL